MAAFDFSPVGETLLADGATGTALQRAGLHPGEAPERWTFERPRDVIALARGYAAAGSDIVYTNTFGGNRIRLGLEGLADRVAEINRTAVRLARAGIAEAGSGAHVFGSIGPSGAMLEPYGDLAPEVASAAFHEQARALVEAGVDGLVCETFGAIEEAILALTAAKRASAHAGIPVLATMAFETSGFTAMGVAPAAAAEQLGDAGADAVGANCSVGPEVVEAAVLAMAAARPGLRLVAKANAGMPVWKNGGCEYPAGPREMAAFAARMRGIGVVLVGGCCGTTSEHIAAMRCALS